MPACIAPQTTGKRNVQYSSSDDPRPGQPQWRPHESLPAQGRSRRETPMNFNPMPMIATSMLALGTVLAHADATFDTIDRYATFSGFGTLGVVHSDYSQADFIGRVDQKHGAGY